MNILVINCGSSSVKYQLVNPESGAIAHKGLIERIGTDKTHAQAIAEVIEAVGEGSVAAVGHRVVHGGGDFFDAHLITADVIAGIEKCVPLAPLHNPANLAGIRAAKEAFPDLQHVAVFDTAFHNRMPRRSRTYAIDTEVAAKHSVRRYGFHGTSHGYVAERAAEHLGCPIEELRIITCHLGNGASVCAVEFGHSVETSMGMTPLEGLVMGTRSGDLDPGVVLYLQREAGMSVDQVDQFLNQDSGLAGLSGLGKDLRDIEKAADEGNDRARLAIAVFAHRVRKYIGGYAATLGGVDAVVMTGGIGENSATMRRRILQRLEFMGVRFDEESNQGTELSAKQPVAELHAKSSRVKLLAIQTNEELEIARQTARVVAGAKQVKSPEPIPVAISARHVHLDRDTMDTLFGKGSELTPHRDLSQPGQYASKQKVNLIGPRNRIDGVRILGPLRGSTQVEISRTDEFKLGVDAPVRGSGHTKGSAPITLEGPKGTVQLDEGLICAWRHIHMTPADAEAYGVEDGDLVEVAIDSEGRDLIFGDVMVRVSPKYSLEMHIDTDEANAAELSQHAKGELVYSSVEGQAAGLLRKR